jgi:H+-translocating NAD(P) transhydrogenase subunit alpha
VSGQITETASGVKIIGYTDLPGRLAAQSSQLYGTNLVNLAKLLCKTKDGQMVLDMQDVIIRNMSVVHQGEVTFPPPAISVTASAKPVAAVAAARTEAPKKTSNTNWFIGIAAVLLLWIGYSAPSDFLAHFTVFLLSCVVGYYLVWNVTHALHTPLMSVTNAISGIIVLGALLQISSDSLLVQALAFVAVLIASINIVGGFSVTHRMLKMFTKGGE